MKERGWGQKIPNWWTFIYRWSILMCTLTTDLVFFSSKFELVNKLDYSGNLNYKIVGYSNGQNLFDCWMVCYSGHGLNDKLIVCYWFYDVSIILVFVIQILTVFAKNVKLQGKKKSLFYLEHSYHVFSIY